MYLFRRDDLLGDGAGSFHASAGSPITASYLAAGIATADFNGDGNLDLVVGTGGSHSVEMLLGDGTGGFTPAGTVGEDNPGFFAVPAVGAAAAGATVALTPCEAAGRAATSRDVR